MLNILAPGVVTSHIGGGFTYAVNQNFGRSTSPSLYSPRVSVSGQEYLPGFGYNPYSNISISLEDSRSRWATPITSIRLPAVIAKY